MSWATTSLLDVGVVLTVIVILVLVGFGILASWKEICRYHSEQLKDP